MFSLATKEQIKTIPTGVRAVPATQIQREEIAADEYMTLAAELGVKTEGLESDAEKNRFLEFLSDRSLVVYDKTEVDKFLVAHAPSGMLFTWKPLLEKDATEEMTLTSNIMFAHQLMGLGQFTQPGQVGQLAPPPQIAPAQRRTNQYTKKVPMVVLMLVKEIRDAFKNASFFISDYAVPRPDPFLMVRLAGAEYIIEHWDEPTFGMKK